MPFYKNLITKYRFWIVGAIVLVLGGFLLDWGYEEFKPLPDNTEFKARLFNFSFPRVYNAEEYATGVVSIGMRSTSSPDGLDPLIEITKYQSDPDTARPADFNTFMKRQASALCGADGPSESVACTEVGITAYTSPTGISGQKLDLTLIRKNLKTGTSTTSTYGPMYVFNTSKASSTPGANYRYSAIFIYPSLAAFLSGTTSPALMDQVLATFTIKS